MRTILVTNYSACGIRPVRVYTETQKLCASVRLLIASTNITDFDNFGGRCFRDP